jgi:hypothetical protein
MLLVLNRLQRTKMLLRKMAAINQDPMTLLVQTLAKAIIAYYDVV